MIFYFLFKTIFLTFVKSKAMLRVAVIDDDPLVHRMVSRAVEMHCPQISVVANADCVRDGLTIIHDAQPDIVIVDVKLPDGNGFELINQFSNPDFKVIFISAFHEYALKGYKCAAVDYLLKPIHIEELVQVLLKTVELINTDERNHLQKIDDVAIKHPYPHKLILKTLDQVHLVNSDEIIHIEASGSYSTFFLEGNKKLVISKAIKEYEELLIDKGFFRIHKSHLVNINKISYFNKADGGCVVMVNGASLPVASRKKDLLLNLFYSLE